MPRRSRDLWAGVWRAGSVARSCGVLTGWLLLTDATVTEKPEKREPHPTSEPDL